MRRAAVLVLALLALSAACCARAAEFEPPLTDAVREAEATWWSSAFDIEPRIVNGQAVSSASVFPWYFGMRSPNVCGAALIAPQYLLTAAHCITTTTVSSYTFIYGCTSTTSCSNYAYASAVYKHPSFDSSTLDYDFAIVKLTAAIYGRETIDIINNATSRLECPNCLNATVMGWGTTSYGGSQSSTLLRATVKVVSSGSCGLSGVTSRMICAGDHTTNTDSCQGDSGGPLAVSFTTTSTGTLTTRWAVIGIVSWGSGCASSTSYGVYSRVSSVLGGIANIVAGGSSWTASDSTPFVSPSCPSSCTGVTSYMGNATATSYQSSSAQALASSLLLVVIALLVSLVAPRLLM